MNKIFDLEYQYALYLQRMGLREIDLHPVQKIQLKHSFMGAWGQLLMLMQTDLAALPEDDGIEVLESFNKQLADFWLAQTDKQN